MFNMFYVILMHYSLSAKTKPYIKIQNLKSKKSPLLGQEHVIMDFF